MRHPCWVAGPERNRKCFCQGTATNHLQEPDLHGHCRPAWLLCQACVWQATEPDHDSCSLLTVAGTIRAVRQTGFRLRPCRSQRRPLGWMNTTPRPASASARICPGHQDGLAGAGRPADPLVVPGVGDRQASPGSTGSAGSRAIAASSGADSRSRAGPTPVRSSIGRAAQPDPGLIAGGVGVDGAR
jgi:hypothetical protein